MELDRPLCSLILREPGLIEAIGELLQYQQNPEHNCHRLVELFYDEREWRRKRQEFYKNRRPGLELVKDLCSAQTFTIGRLITGLEHVVHYEALALLRPERKALSPSPLPKQNEFGAAGDTASYELKCENIQTCLFPSRCT